MAQQETVEGDIQRWLAAVRVESLCQWNVMMCMYRHRTILMPPDQLAPLVGYQTGTILATLSTLAAHELVEVSTRTSAATRLYRFGEPSEPSRRDALERLLALGEHRSGRLVLRKYLCRKDRSPLEELDRKRRTVEDAKRVVEIARRHSEEVRRTIRQRVDH